MPRGKNDMDNLKIRSLSILKIFILAVCIIVGSSCMKMGDSFDFSSLKLPPGFKTAIYLTGTGFDPNKDANVSGLPALVRLTFDHQGILFLARTGNRLSEIYGKDSAPIYRIPLGTRLIKPSNEKKFLFGPELRHPHAVAVNKKGEVYVSTRDTLAGYGSIYRLALNGEATLFAGGPPIAGSTPLFVHPEGIAIDEENHVYVIDYVLGVVVKLSASGKVLNPRFMEGLGRGRILTYDPRGFLWVGTDGLHIRPHIDGWGRIYRMSLADSTSEFFFGGPLPSGLSLSPEGYLFVAQRRSGFLFALTPEGKRIDFGIFSENTAIRTLAFPPDNEITRKAGIVGDLFVIVFPELDYPVREIIRIKGPFDEFVRAVIN
jgi:sugar lactone lactonase YvrE